ncbi:MAG: heavy metal translocating P-type ATPase metal-binding domain-containing protein, partial [Myxococcota bacterium]
MSPAPARTGAGPLASACPHCGAAVETPCFCCEGCRMVATTIAGAGLERYYAERTAPAPRPGAAPAAWSEAPVEALPDGRSAVRLHVG